MIDYLKIAQEYHVGRADGFLTDQPVGVKLAEDGIIQTRYDAQSMQWIFSRPSRIRYQTAKQLIMQYRQEYAEKWGKEALL